MKSMTELISPKAQEAFAGFMSTRVEYGVFTGRDLKAVTKGNSEFFAQFADLRDVEIRRFSQITTSAWRISKSPEPAKTNTSSIFTAADL